MEFKRAQLANIRNIVEADLSFHPTTNIIFGENGSGKTSILEALHIVSLGKSFRPGRYSTVITHDSQVARVVAEVETPDIGLQRVGVERHRNGDILARVDGENVRSATDLARRFPILALDDRVFNTLEGGSEARRRLIAWVMFHVKHDYQTNLSKYRRLSRQRLALLKSDQTDIEQLRAVDKLLSPVVALITNTTRQLLSTVAEANKGYVGQKKDVLDPVLYVTFSLSSGFGKVIDEICQNNPDIEVTSDDIYQAYRDVEQSDVERGYSNRGINRSDVIFKSNGRRTEHIFSRGQKKRLIVRFIANLVSVCIKDASIRPVLLLDDISAELDNNRLAELMSELRDSRVQCFYTVAGVSSDDLPRAMFQNNHCSMFHVKHGVPTLFHNDQAI